MSRGKYSPRCPNSNKPFTFFDRNARGEIPPERAVVVMVSTATGDEEIYFANYDPEGYDSYGYSGYAADGNYVGMGNGIDRLGHTEMDYLVDFTDDEFNDL